MYEPEDKQEQDIKAMFTNVADDSLSPSPYLKTRVLARLEERKETGRKLLFWRFAAAAGVVLAVLFALLPLNKQEKFDSGVGTPFAVRVETGGQIAVIELELPEGLEFYSAKHPEISGLRSLRVAAGEKRSIPFVLKSDRAGEAEVKVRFFGPENTLIAEKNIRVKVAQAGKNLKELL